MIDDTKTEIRRHADGSIDYAYYAGRASAARNSEFRRVVRGTVQIHRLRSPLFSLVATVMLLAIIL